MTLSFDSSEIDLPTLFGWLREAYWSQNRSGETIECSIDNSLCLSAWDGDTMVGFARVVTDYATFAWLCDVIVAPDRRGQAIGKTMVQALMDREDLKTVRWMLGTRDAHSLYEQYGFQLADEPDRFMIKGFRPRPPRT